MIKVFTTSAGRLTSESGAGDDLSKEIEKWIKSLARGIEIISQSCSAGRYGYIVTIHYKPI